MAEPVIGDLNILRTMEPYAGTGRAAKRIDTDVLKEDLRVYDKTHAGTTYSDDTIGRIGHILTFFQSRQATKPAKDQYFCYWMLRFFLTELVRFSPYSADDS